MRRHDLARWHSNLGLVLQGPGDLPGAWARIEQALQSTEAALVPAPRRRRGRNLGRVLRTLGDLAGARVQFERALQITEAALAPTT